MIINLGPQHYYEFKIIMSLLLSHDYLLIIIYFGH